MRILPNVMFLGPNKTEVMAKIFMPPNLVKKCSGFLRGNPAAIAIVSGYFKFIYSCQSMK